MLINDRNKVSAILENLRVNESIPSDMKKSMEKHDGVVLLGKDDDYTAPTLAPSMKAGKWDYTDENHPEDRPLTVDETIAIKIFNAWKNKQDFKKFLK